MHPVVLIIEDDRAIQSLWQDLLLSEGYKVLLCTTPHAARQIVKEQTPDLIILDYLFDGFPLGRSFLRTLKTDSSTKHIPVIVCSAATHLAHADTGYFHQHQVQFLAKPCTADALILAINQVVHPPRT